MGKKSRKFAGMLPVVIDVETGGFNPHQHALLEIAAVPLIDNDEGRITKGVLFHEHIKPYRGLDIDPQSLAITGIDPGHPFRFEKPEALAMQGFNHYLIEHLNRFNKRKAVLVGHNAHFDLAFVLQAMKRSGVDNCALHAFTVFDTATLAGCFLGESVLARALGKAGITHNPEMAHSAIYDCMKTADLFMKILDTFA